MDLETSFVPASSGTYTIRARGVYPGYAGSTAHLTFASPAPEGGGGDVASLAIAVR